MDDLTKRKPEPDSGRPIGNQTSGPGEPPPRPQPAPRSNVVLRTPGGGRLVLTLDEYRLALLGLVDFDGNWEALEVATALVVDGEAKAGLLRRLLPNAAHLPALVSRELDSLELLSARFWFRQEPVAEPAARSQPSASPAALDPTAPPPGEA